MAGSDPISIQAEIWVVDEEEEMGWTPRPWLATSVYINHNEHSKHKLTVVHVAIDNLCLFPVLLFLSSSEGCRYVVVSGQIYHIIEPR